MQPYTVYSIYGLLLHFPIVQKLFDMFKNSGSGCTDLSFCDLKCCVLNKFLGYGLSFLSDTTSVMYTYTP